MSLSCNDTGVIDVQGRLVNLSNVSHQKVLRTAEVKNEYPT